MIFYKTKIKVVFNNNENLKNYNSCTQYHNDDLQIMNQ